MRIQKIKNCFLSVSFGFLLTVYCSLAYADYTAGKNAFDNHDYAIALKELIPLVKQGDPRAQRIVGKMYRGGYGVEADMLRGTSLIHKAANKGFAPAQYDLGMIFYSVAVTKAIYTKAVKWLTEAAVQGHLEAQFYLGKMYRDGDGVEADDVKALVLFNAAGKKIKMARGAREQLIKRMSKGDVSRAKNMKMSVFKKQAKIKTFAESNKTVKDVKGKCGEAGKELYVSSRKLEDAANSLKKCVGEDWTGDLCTSEIDELNKMYEQLNGVTEILRQHC
ncbi:MAG: sel1 repeat family protein [Rhodospirillaceae bacterium]|jgi:uncharacterized protein|nr:sel1 repeat family protein [Rhodospirillaceae bacterium]MBT4219055.1 sel1 repeat family protein [Rhodospirillaceae bacterium]MBT4464575.1 sel1 repeat family protein [Rhodospirillaceae bacterium]MBT5308554.1 sel1 repeat family protein [Rhodospirillaceae bacterium]MBT6407512.1 sel1 repeat family protein [Rhodospirillaceae bacterium]